MPALATSATYQLTLTVNGERRTAGVDPRTSLLDLLRERYHIATCADVPDEGAGDQSGVNCEGGGDVGRGYGEDLPGRDGEPVRGGLLAPGARRRRMPGVHY